MKKILKPRNLAIMTIIGGVVGYLIETITGENNIILTVVAPGFLLTIYLLLTVFNKVKKEKTWNIVLLVIFLVYFLLTIVTSGFLSGNRNGIWVIYQIQMVDYEPITYYVSIVNEIVSGSYYALLSIFMLGIVLKKNLPYKLINILSLCLIVLIETVTILLAIKTKSLDITRIGPLIGCLSMIPFTLFIYQYANNVIKKNND